MSTLIAYTTEYGTARKCSLILNEFIENRGTLVDLCEERVSEFTNYSSVVIGASIHMGKIQRELKRFLKKNQNILLSLPLFIFINCADTSKFNEYLENNFSEELLNHANFKICFGGELNIENVSNAHKHVLKMVKQDKSFSRIINKNINKMATRLLKVI